MKNHLIGNAAQNLTRYLPNTILKHLLLTHPVFVLIFLD
jgi:hypothetical protein